MDWLRRFLFEDEPVIGIQKTTNYRYMKIQRFLLDITGSWPPERNKEVTFAVSLKKFLTFITIVASFVSEVVYIRGNAKHLSFIEVGHSYITIFMTLLNFSRSISMTYSKRFATFTRDFLEIYHLFHHKDKSEYAMLIHKRVHYICHLFTLYLTILMFSGMTFFNLVPLFNNIISGKYKPGGLGNDTFEYAVYFSYPFDSTRSPWGHFVAVCYNWITSILCTTWFSSFDLHLSLIVFHLWGHFKILLNKLESFPIPPIKKEFYNGYALKCQTYEPEELDLIAKLLKDCVNTHRDILKFTAKLSETYGFMLLTYYMFFQTTCCVLLLQCNQLTLEAGFRYFPLTFIVFQQLVQVSYIIELIGTVSERLKFAVYHLPWEHMDTRNRIIVMILLINVQEPVHLKALGVANVGLTTMASILKTSFSYFTFLQNM